MSNPRCNFELKARCPELEAARAAAVGLGARFQGVLEQLDTYFAVPRGRLKLRESAGSQPELIYYERADDPSIRSSNYHLVPVADPTGLKAALSAALGIRAVVRKRRELLLWENVRIHLDAVENLGNFIELEAVIRSDADREQSPGRMQQLVEALRIGPQSLIERSYGELMHAQDE